MTTTVSEMDAVDLGVKAIINKLAELIGEEPMTEEEWESPAAEDRQLRSELRYAFTDALSDEGYEVALKR